MTYRGASPGVLPSVEHDWLTENTLIGDLRGLALFHNLVGVLSFHVTLVVHLDIYIFLRVECVCLQRGNCQTQHLQHKEKGACSTSPAYLQFHVHCTILLVDLWIFSHA